MSKFMHLLSKYWRMCLSRTIVLYIVAGIGLVTLTDYATALQVAKLRVLNRLMPPLSDLMRGNIDGSRVDADLMDKYLLYYAKVSEFLPTNANGFYMKAYCLSQQGKYDKSIAAYKRSIELNPQFFWAHYNLGIVYLKNNDPRLASDAFAQALKTKPDTSLKIILASKVYQQLLSQIRKPAGHLTSSIKAAYQDCYKLLAVCKKLKGAFSVKMPDQIYNQLETRIF